jgi:hypothetical protein
VGPGADDLIRMRVERDHDDGKIPFASGLGGPVDDALVP